MLRGGTILSTAILSVIFLKRKLKSFNILGIFLVMVGIGLTGIAAFKTADSGEATTDTTDTTIGTILTLLCTFFYGVLRVTEEKLFSKFALHPL